MAKSKIRLDIPSTPRRAHDVVVNASLVWNRAQIWFRDNFALSGNAYSFIESKESNVSVSFSVPSKYDAVAVAWTEYVFAPSSTTILAAHIYLDQAVFHESQEGNATARRYAFRLALHELGRVLGLGSVIDSRDLMNPLATPTRATDPLMLSTLDLFAVHALASRTTSTNFIHLDTDQYQLVDALLFLNNTKDSGTPSTEHSVTSTPCGTRDTRPVTCMQ